MARTFALVIADALHVEHVRICPPLASLRSCSSPGGCRYHSRTRTVCGKLLEDVSRLAGRASLVSASSNSPESRAPSRFIAAPRFSWQLGYLVIARMPQKSRVLHPHPHCL